jgi:hypothetical protein
VLAEVEQQFIPALAIASAVGNYYKTKSRIMVNRIFSLILFLFFVSPLKSQVLSPESTKSVELLKLAWIILDSTTLTVFPQWTNYRQIPVFIGSPGKQGLFINPDKELPHGYLQIEADSIWKIFVRDSCNVGFSGGGVGVSIDKIYYPHYLKLDLYTSAFKDNHISFLEKYFSINKLPDSVIIFIKSPEYYISVALHEAFHVFQQKSKHWQLKRDINYLKPEIATLSYVEGMLLQEALKAKSDEMAKESVQKFLTVRNYKNRKLSKRQVNYEEDYEWVEGGAMYIQTEILRTLLSISQKNCLFYLDSLNFYNSIVNFNEPGNKEYYYGQAEAYLLDRLYGPNWKEKILLKDIYLIDLLEEAINYSEQAQKEQLQNILNAYHYKTLKRKTRQQFKKSNYIIGNV